MFRKTGVKNYWWKCNFTIHLKIKDISWCLEYSLISLCWRNVCKISRIVSEWFFNICYLKFDFTQWLIGLYLCLNSMKVQNDQADNITLERKYTVALLISLKKLLPTIFFYRYITKYMIQLGNFELNSCIFFFTSGFYFRLLA